MGGGYCMKVAVMGRTQMLYDTISILESAGHEIVYIGTSKAAPEYTKNESDFETFAEERNILFTRNLKEFKCLISQTESFIADIAISINWPMLIDLNCISKFKLGILNAHCGDLPRYRGNACPNWAIINGEKQICVSIHFMEAESLDSGDIVIKNYYPINELTTITEIYTKLEQDIPNMFVKALKIVEDYPEKIYSQSKDINDSLRCYPRIPSDSLIDWNRNAIDINRLIHASCYPFAGAYTYSDYDKIYILDSDICDFEMPCYVIPGQVVKIESKLHTVWVACRNGNVIIKRIRVNNQEMYPDSYFKSMRIRLGYCVMDEIYELKREVKNIMNLIVDEKQYDDEYVDMHLIKK